jgi:hypothetical protein
MQMCYDVTFGVPFLGGNYIIYISWLCIVGYVLLFDNHDMYIIRQ